jgi:hypothetical protein
MKPHNQHPIEPPSQDLVRKWIEDWAGGQMKGPVTEDLVEIATQAARWGADQELEACEKWVASHFDGMMVWSATLSTARRPKPPSLKEQAIESLDRALVMWMTNDFNKDEFVALGTTIRQALETLPEGAQ